MVRTLLLGLLLLSGCVMDQKGRIDQPVAPPVINVPPSQKVDTAELRQGIKDDITASSNATANQMTGAVNASVSKLAEKITGLEASLSAVVTNTATMNTQASADLRAKLEASLTAVTDMKATLSMVNEFNAKMENRINADVSLIRDLKAQIGDMSAQLTATANGQVGLSNRIESKLETVTNSAGRDVNYIPRDLAEVMMTQERSNSRTIVVVVSILAGVITTALGWLGKVLLTQAHDERRLLNALMLEMAGRLDPNDAIKFEHKFSLLSKK
jgi:hypothetical protein